MNRKQHFLSFLSHCLYCIKHNVQGIPIAAASRKPHTANQTSDWLWCLWLCGYGPPSIHFQTCTQKFPSVFYHYRLLAAKQFASCHLLVTDTRHRFPLCWDTNNWCLSGTNAYMSMVIMCRPDVYHLLPMCHIHIKIRKQFSALHCLIPYFMKHPCINCCTI